MYKHIMNWYKKNSLLAWEGKEFYHLINTLKFEIDDFPELTINDIKENISPNTIGFYITKNNTTVYNIDIQKKEVSLRIIITKEEGKMVGSKIYNVLFISPQEVIRELLLLIYNDSGEEFDNGMV